MILVYTITSFLLVLVCAVVELPVNIYYHNLQLFYFDILLV